MTLSAADNIKNKQPIFFSDFFNNFEKHPISGNLMKVTNEKSILQSVRNLLRTNFYERRYEPRVGTNIFHSLFEIGDSVTIESIKYGIITTIGQFEPRVEISDVSIDTSEINQGLITITLTLYIINTPTPLTTSIILRKVR